MSSITVPDRLERGQLATITVVWSDAAGVIWTGADPTVTWEVLDPAGTATTPSATKVSASTWTCSVALSAPGTWSVRAVAAGSLTAAISGSFNVLATPFDS